jgi:hypothetical protein
MKWQGLFNSASLCMGHGLVDDFIHLGFFFSMVRKNRILPYFLYGEKKQDFTVQLSGNFNSVRTIYILVSI